METVELDHDTKLLLLKTFTSQVYGQDVTRDFMLAHLERRGFNPDGEALDNAVQALRWREYFDTDWRAALESYEDVPDGVSYDDLDERAKSLREDEQRNYLYWLEVLAVSP